jgi:hypothetical protein
MFPVQRPDQNFTRPVFTKDRRNAVTGRHDHGAFTRKLLEVGLIAWTLVELDEKTKKYIDKSTMKLL